MQATTLEQPRVRRIRTPEGISLPFEIGGAGERLLAFFVDFLVIHLFVVAVLLAGLSASLVDSSGLALSFALVASFLLRNFYFVFMELLWGGSTFGKRMVSLRVVARDGGPLRAESIFARNLTRDLEVFLPLVALTSPRMIAPSGPGLAVVAATLWLFVFASLPLWNRDRLRVGDLVAGTMVVRAPRAVLLSDLTEESILPTSWQRPEEVMQRVRFTPAQLDEYGIHELQVLEQVLRETPGSRRDSLLGKVAERIKRRIEWAEPEPRPDDELFLRAFYRAQRERLERGMLFGDRRERKQPRKKS